MGAASRLLKGAMLLLLSAILVSTVVASDQHVLTETARIATLRDATEKDVDQVARVMLDAFSPGAAAKYTTPGYEQYKDYIRYCAKKDFKKFFSGNSSDSWIIKVITVPCTGACTHEKDEVVACAAWRTMTKADDSKVRSLLDFISPLTIPNLVTIYEDTDDPKYDCSLRLGTNVTRAEHHSRQLDEAHKKYLDSQFDKQFYLAALATHPNWDGHGFGAMNLHWGMEFARMKNLPITLLATPAGYPLYLSEGFQEIHNVTMKMLDGEGELWYEAMKYEST